MSKLIAFIIMVPALLLSLQINIISPGGKYGLANDVNILKKELELLGHDVYNLKPSGMSKEKVDVNIHVQNCFLSAFYLADKNYLLPNPDWYKGTAASTANFDLILCKTREAERIFKTANPNCKFISFTSRDCFNETLEKNLKGVLHLSSSGILKGTNRLIETYSENPQLSLLTMINSRSAEYPNLPNLHTIDRFLPVEELKQMMNQFGIHICPSETEGFGHYIFEAFSCGAVVITTDGPPMNEFISDDRCLISYEKVSKWRLANRYFFRPESFVEKIEKLLSLSDDELRKIGERNRQFYLQNDRYFKACLLEIFGTKTEPLLQTPEKPKRKKKFVLI